MPCGEEIVTWPGLEDALNGVRGEFAAYRPESRARSVVDVSYRYGIYCYY